MTSATTTRPRTLTPTEQVEHALAEHARRHRAGEKYTSTIDARLMADTLRRYREHGLVEPDPHRGWRLTPDGRLAARALTPGGRNFNEGDDHA